ncbi:MAG: hypothetical protein B7W98_01195, partial [Parcubacteria group bacterium 20-58-5]
ARGTGLAAALVDTVADWARAQGGEALYLHVTSTVARARRFYEKIGFVATSELITTRLAGSTISLRLRRRRISRSWRRRCFTGPRGWPR